MFLEKDSFNVFCGFENGAEIKVFEDWKVFELKLPFLSALNVKLAILEYNEKRKLISKDFPSFL